MGDDDCFELTAADVHANVEYVDGIIAQVEALFDQADRLVGEKIMSDEVRGDILTCASDVIYERRDAPRRRELRRKRMLQKRMAEVEKGSLEQQQEEEERSAVAAMRKTVAEQGADAFVVPPILSDGELELLQELGIPVVQTQRPFCLASLRGRYFDTISRICFDLEGAAVGSLAQDGRLNRLSGEQISLLEGRGVSYSQPQDHSSESDSSPFFFEA